MTSNYLESVFDFGKATEILIVVFFDESLLLQFDENTYHFPKITFQQPISFTIKSFIFNQIKCLIKEPYFVGMHNTIAIFTVRVYKRTDYFVPGYLFYPIEDAYKVLNMPEHIKSEIFYKAYELMK